jgi:hypothetical protein
MTDSTGNNPFSQFSPAAGYEMFETMLKMMQLNGFPPGASQGAQNPLSFMSNMAAPLMNLDELDKRITDMRTVEQWLKLNLNMLQSTIQALEVQRATLATLHAFSEFAQQSMTPPPSTSSSSSSAPSPSPSSSSFASFFSPSGTSPGTSAAAPFGAFGPFSAVGALAASAQGGQPVQHDSPDDGAAAEQSAGADARAASWPLNPFAFAMGNMASGPVSESDRETDKQGEPHDSPSPSADAISAKSGAMAAAGAQTQDASWSGIRAADQAADEAPSATHPSASGVFGAPSGTSPAFGSASAASRSGTVAESAAISGVDALTGAQGGATAQAGARADAGDAGSAGGAAADGAPSLEKALDPSVWWNLLQTQFNQIAGLAMASAAQPDPTPNAGSEPTPNPGSGKKGTQTAKSARPAVDSVGRGASGASSTAAHLPVRGVAKAGTAAGTAAGARDVAKEAAKGDTEKTATQKKATQSGKTATTQSATRKAVTHPEKKAATQSGMKTATQKAATPKTATQKAATPKTATQKAATPKTATPKTATPKTATPKTATPKTATQKTATQKTPMQKTATQSATKKTAKQPANTAARQAVSNKAAPASKVRTPAGAHIDATVRSDPGDIRGAELSSDALATKSGGAAVVVARRDVRANPQASRRANRTAARQANPPVAQTDKPGADAADAATSHANPGHTPTATRTNGSAEATIRVTPGGGLASSAS